MLQLRAALKDVLAGALFVLLGGGFAVGALQYDIGTPLRMGPGYVPLLLGGMLAGLGVVIAVRGLLAGENEAMGGVEWRALALITAALLFFGLTVRGLGVAGALFGAILLAALARSRTTPLQALLTAVSLTALSIVVFIVVLQLRLPLLGPWVRF